MRYFLFIIFNILLTLAVTISADIVAPNSPADCGLVIPPTTPEPVEFQAGDAMGVLGLTYSGS